MSFSWYIISVSVGLENRVANSIRSEAAKHSLTDSFGEIVVPTSKVATRRGKRQMLDKKMLPGYILINMHLDERSWSIIKNINGVTKILGDDNKPQKVHQKEIDRILESIKQNELRLDSDESFTIGELVNVIEGPFKTFSGKVSCINKEKKKLTVVISILCRETSAEFDFHQVKRIE
ncbi:MAG: transcription termination/antitermination protein NusG [Proteobacteria bacterium]|nr:transcription termination/antitermination protein NusG [Pseudomonadota bacterium]